jgi:hypothetical protein
LRVLASTCEAMTSSSEQSDEAVAGTAISLTYPKDDRDGWEPGEPSVRAMAPSALCGAVLPLAVYYLVRNSVSSDALALAIAGIPAAAWVAVEWIRRRRLDPIGGIVLFGFIAGLAASFALGGDAFVLKVRDCVFTSLFGLGCLLSLWIGRRPLMFYLGRSLSAGNDLRRQKVYDELWELPPARAVFYIITVAWGVGLICDAATRVLLASNLSTGAFLAASPVATAVYVGGLFAFTLALSRWSRTRSPEAAGGYPEGGGSVWWWMKFWLGRVGAADDGPGRGVTA